MMYNVPAYAEALRYWVVDNFVDNFFQKGVDKLTRICYNVDGGGGE